MSERVKVGTSARKIEVERTDEEDNKNLALVSFNCVLLPATWD